MFGLCTCMNEQKGLEEYTLNKSNESTSVGSGIIYALYSYI